MHLVDAMKFVSSDGTGSFAGRDRWWELCSERGFSCRLWTRDTDSLMEKSLLSWEKE
jgi:hypothetical protein